MPQQPRRHLYTLRQIHARINFLVFTDLQTSFRQILQCRVSQTAHRAFKTTHPLPQIRIVSTPGHDSLKGNEVARMAHRMRWLEAFPEGETDAYQELQPIPLPRPPHPTPLPSLTPYTRPFPPQSNHAHGSERWYPPPLLRTRLFLTFPA